MWHAFKPDGSAKFWRELREKMEHCVVFGLLLIVVTDPWKKWACSIYISIR
jgi:hypothetical protein